MEYNKQLAFILPGDEIEGFYLLKSAEVKTSSNGSQYLNAVISDASGEAEARHWDYHGGEFEKNTGKVIKIRARVTEYKGKIQVQLDKMRMARDDDNYSINDIIPSAPIDSLKELEYVTELVESIEDEEYRLLAQQMLDRHMIEFGKIPAAKSVHHAFLSGLLMHTANMLRIADFLAVNIYPYAVDRSLLLTGTLLHDFAKAREYAFNEFGLVNDVTTEGMLIGHLVLGSEEVGEMGRSLGISHEKVTLVKHMLLSHHGKPEFGAAVEPCIAESELLSQIDMLDSRMEIYSEAYDRLEPGDVSERIFALEKKIYRHQ